MVKVMVKDGGIVEKDAGDVVYVALLKRGGYWIVSGVFYHSPQEAEMCTAGMMPEKLVVVRVKIPDVMALAEDS